MNKLISILKLVKKGVFVIFGQHDIHYHNPNVVKTPLGLLLASGAVKWARYCSSDIFECNYGEDYNKGNAKILVIHFPITKDTPPFFMKEAKSAKQFLKEVDWADMVFSGDFHEHHVTAFGKRLLVNPGPISRAAKDKMDFIPKVVIVDQDTINYYYEVFDIPVEKDVFDLDVVDKDNVVSYKEDVRELAGTIRSSIVGAKYHEILDKVIKTTEPRAEVRTIISEIMEKVYERTKAA